VGSVSATALNWARRAAALVTAPAYSVLVYPRAYPCGGGEGGGSVARPPATGRSRRGATSGHIPRGKGRGTATVRNPSLPGGVILKKNFGSHPIEIIPDSRETQKRPFGI